MRKAYIDNIRFSIVWLVVIYHVIYIFNSAGVISNINKIGIPIFDSFLYFVYPWFMCCLFLISGMSARYSLETKSSRQFLRERVRRLLLPSVAGIFILGWIIGYITSLQTDMFGGYGDLIPSFFKYVIYCLVGIGPLWFAHEVFLASIILLIVRRIDKRDRLWQLGKKVNLFALLFLFLPIWASSYLFNTPFVEVYRNGIYVFLFLLGYYVFSHEETIEILRKRYILFGIFAILLGVLYVKIYFGSNYASAECLTSLFTNLYLWIAILAILGLSKEKFNFKNKFTLYMVKNSFGVYVFHYPILILLAYFIITYLQMPMILNYVVILVLDILLTLCANEIVKRIPILRSLLLGK